MNEFIFVARQAGVGGLSQGLGAAKFCTI